jgi:hypothetical protein
VPDPFQLPWRGGIPRLVDLREWDRRYGNRSPNQRGGTWRMMDASIFGLAREIAAERNEAPPNERRGSDD